MHRAEHKTGFGTWLRHACETLMFALEGMDRSPMEDVSGRIERLEREVATLKNARD